MGTGKINADFTGASVLVTGGAQGIGFEIARYFATAGAKVSVLDRDSAQLKAAWDGVDNVRQAAVDVADADAVVDAVAGIVDWAGGVDVAVNNAGITRDAASGSCPPSSGRRCSTCTWAAPSRSLGR